MITRQGESVMFDYLTGRVQRWAGKLAVGVGETAAQRSDVRLDFHVADAPIDIIVPDFYEQVIIIRGVVPLSLNCEIQELGVFYEPTPATDRSILSFNPLIEQFVGGSQVFESRTETSSVVLTDGETIEYFDYPLMLENMPASDQFRIGFDANGVAAHLIVRFVVDVNNYYEFDLDISGQSGFNVSRFNKRAAAIVGMPDWGSIQGAELELQGAGSIIRLDDMRAGPPKSPELLLAREVVQEPVKTQEGIETEIEYKLKVNFGD